MGSPLKRLINKLQWLTSLDSVRRDAKGCLETRGIPPKYMGKELASEYVLYWTRIQGDDGEGLVQIQVDALERWGSFQVALEKEKEETELPLE